VGKEEPKNPDAAFIAFCRKKHQREGRPRKKWFYKSAGALRASEKSKNDKYIRGMV
jgi:hypothetical protein